MRTGNKEYVTPRRRTALLLIGFTVLVGIGVMTVVRPELDDEPSDGKTSEVETRKEPGADEPAQE